MKIKNINILLLISILSIIAGCSKDPAPIVCVDYASFSFKQTYLEHFQNDDFFLIKGVALDVNKHGREIKVIEDLKGNFTGKSSIFVWGTTGSSSCGNNPDARMDYITQYQKNDTLIMFVEKVQSNKKIERSGDYTTLNCFASVLKLSNGYVTGYINIWGVAVLWEELKNELQTRLNSYEEPDLWQLIPDPFYIAYKGIESRKGASYHFIKGLVLDYYKDGIKIEVISDLIGNFPEETKTTIVWGHSSQYLLGGLLDDLKLYNRQDTLLMLLRQVKMSGEINSKGVKEGDYSTLPYTFSVLKLLENNVTGYITSCYKGEETMSWEEFQELLNLTMY